MTETPRPPKTLTPARLEELRALLETPDELTQIESQDLFQHIDALTAERDEWKNTAQVVSRNQLKACEERDALTAEVAALQSVLRNLADDYEAMLGDGLTESNAPIVLREARLVLYDAPVKP